MVQVGKIIKLAQIAVKFNTPNTTEPIICDEETVVPFYYLMYAIGV